jgi:hypothetical protein
VTDDIVTRLRESHGQGCTCGAWNYSECGCSEAVWAEMFITEAADEIEYLRMQISEIKYEYQKLWEKHNKPMVY